MSLIQHVGADAASDSALGAIRRNGLWNGRFLTCAVGLEGFCSRLRISSTRILRRTPESFCLKVILRPRLDLKRHVLLIRKDESATLILTGVDGIALVD